MQLPRLAALVSLALVAACAAPSASWREGQDVQATPQRPTFSKNTSTTAQGTVEIEAGLLRDPGDLFDTPTTVKYGLSAQDELFIGLSPFKMVELPGDDGEGFGDVTLGWRQRFWEQQDSGTSAAWMAYVKLPTADEDEGLGSGEVDGFVAGSLTMATEDWSANAYGQFGLLGELDGSGVDHQEAVSAVFDMPFAGTNAGGLAELAAVFTPERDLEEVFTILGVNWSPLPGVVLDTGVLLGLTDDAPDFQYFIGITRNLGRISGYALRGR
jgi:hypothetical protein